MAFIKRAKPAKLRMQPGTRPLSKLAPDKAATLLDYPEEGFLDWEPDQWADHYRLGAKLQRYKGTSLAAQDA
jgi:hypothetical protein